MSTRKQSIVIDIKTLSKQLARLVALLGQNASIFFVMDYLYIK